MSLSKLKKKLEKQKGLIPERLSCSDMGNEDDNVDPYEMCVDLCYHTNKDLLKAVMPLLEEIGEP